SLLQLVTYTYGPPRSSGDFTASEQERGLSRMADVALFDQERVPEQPAAGTQPAGDLGEEPPVEEAHHDDVGGRARTEARRIEVHLDAGDPGGNRPHVRETGPRHVDGDHRVAAGGEERRVAPRARGEVEGASRDQQVRVLDEEGRCRTGFGRVAAMLRLPAVPILARHAERIVAQLRPLVVC